MYFSSLINRLNLAEPVTLVRSPTFHKAGYRRQCSAARGQTGGSADFRQLARRQTDANGAAHGGDAPARSAAAAANNIQEARFPPIRNLFRHGVGRVVLAGVRQAGVRVRGDGVTFGNPATVLDVLAQFIRPQRWLRPK